MGCGGNSKTNDKAADGADSDQPAEGIEGSLDQALASGIAGWAWDRKRPDSPINVDIYDGDVKLATVQADLFRDDLLKEKIGNGKHGFNYPMPDRLKDGKSHKIRATASGTKKDLDLSPKTFKSP
jgi:hypothetical protein